MDLATLGTSGAMALAAWKSPELLKELYVDIAKPGVSQVGKALETIVETGSLALLPLRMLNQRAKEWERRNFEEFAEKISKHSIEEVQPLRPEIGIPILDKLSSTVDSDLRELFLNLLTSSCIESRSEYCHPSFAHVLGLLSPDEARLLKSWRKSSSIPYLSIGRSTKKGTQEIQNFSLLVPGDIEFKSNFEVYMNNMSGLGILEYTTEKWMSDPSNYSDLISVATKDHPDILPSQLQNIGMPMIDRKDYPDSFVYYEKGIIKIRSYGQLLQLACIDG